MHEKNHNININIHTLLYCKNTENKTKHLTQTLVLELRY